MFAGPLKKHVLNGPSHFYPISDQRPGPAQAVRPLSRGMRSVSKSNKPVVATIVHPLFGGGPFAVFGSVAKIVINSVYGHAFRTLAHVRKEVFKFMPAFANYNSPTKIPLTSINVGMLASGQHRLPGHISRALGHPVGGVGGFRCFASLLPLEASARLASARAQMVACCDVFIPTLTKAYPRRISPFNAMLAQDGKPSKNLPRKIDSFAHGRLLHMARRITTDKV